MPSIPDAPDPALCDAATLIELVRSGDSGALDQMTRCYGARLVAVGRAHCGERGADAAQDAWLAAAEHLDDFRGDGSLEGWLVRMVINACRRMQRGRKNDPAQHAALDAEPIADRAPVSDGALTRRLGDALAVLEPTDQAAVLLADVEGWTAAEIAAAMNMTPGQTRTRLSRARQRLRRQLEPVWQTWVDTLSADDGSTG